MNPEQEIELVLDNPRSAHILGMPGISKASAVVVHQIFHTHAKGQLLGGALKVRYDSLVGGESIRKMGST
jgi:hypothetical protein